MSDKTSISLPSLILEGEEWRPRIERRNWLGAGQLGSNYQEMTGGHLAQIAHSLGLELQPAGTQGSKLEADLQREKKRSLNRRNQCKTLQLALERREGKCTRYIERCWTAEARASELFAKQQLHEQTVRELKARIAELEANERVCFLQG